jgi:hypothetical protein
MASGDAIVSRAPATHHQLPEQAFRHARNEPRRLGSTRNNGLQ